MLRTEIGPSSTNKTGRPRRIIEVNQSLSAISQESLAGFSVGLRQHGVRPCPSDLGFGPGGGHARCTKQEVGQGSAAASAVVTHNKEFVAVAPTGSVVKFQRLSVEPAWTRLLVVFESEPKCFELSYFFSVPILKEIDDVSHAEIL